MLRARASTNKNEALATLTTSTGKKRSQRVFLHARHVVRRRFFSTFFLALQVPDVMKEVRQNLHCPVSGIKAAWTQE